MEKKPHVLVPNRFNAFAVPGAWECSRALWFLWGTEAPPSDTLIPVAGNANAYVTFTQEGYEVFTDEGVYLFSGRKDAEAVELAMKDKSIFVARKDNRLYAADYLGYITGAVRPEKVIRDDALANRSLSPHSAGKFMGALRRSATLVAERYGEEMNRWKDKQAKGWNLYPRPDRARYDAAMEKCEQVTGIKDMVATAIHHMNDVDASAPVATAKADQETGHKAAVLSVPRRQKALKAPRRDIDKTDLR